MTTDTTKTALTDAEWRALTQLMFLIEIGAASAEELATHSGAAVLVKAVESGLIVFHEDGPATSRGR